MHLRNDKDKDPKRDRSDRKKYIAKDLEYIILRVRRLIVEPSSEEYKHDNANQSEDK